MNKLIQFNTITSLINGNYEGNLEYQKLFDRGNFGIGTFDGLDGEMIGYNNKWFQIGSDATVHQVLPTQTTPFACVTDFNVDFEFDLLEGGTYEELKQKILEKIKEKGDQYFYAFKIVGAFNKIDLMTIEEVKEPYENFSTLSEQALKIELTEIDGIILGFWCPKYLSALQPEGFHTHFISTENKYGGHVSDFKATQLNVELMQIQKYELVFSNYKNKP
ncbi:acetolactate decarboxylase [Spiroplasma endosymbiont of Labia minor]|uniref:acetolactate decarboxylase n=1 Tax=Spiroplasma endosymbiont of Labia minor TaxID=3066305 RepID=UPI0030D3D6CA